MIRNEKGFTLLELAVAFGIAALAGVAAMLVIVQIAKGNEHNNDYATSVRQAENAGYWINRDMRTAQTVNTDNLTFPDFLVIGWTEWDLGGNPTYHTIRYYFDGLADGVGALKRNHWSSAGANEQTLIAQHIYFNSANATYTSQASFQGSVLTLKLTSISDRVLESREYEITRRINY